MDTFLESWQESTTKQRIFDFVETVTNPSSRNFVPVAERVAVFDNDGTLWCERPLYVQFVFAFGLIAEKARQNPELQNQQPYKSILAGDMDWIKGYLSNETLPDFIEMVLDVVAGSTQIEFDMKATAWLKQTVHPLFGVLYTQLIYQPMLELLDYLRLNDFQVFICSGGGMDFVRLFSEEIYNIPRQNVIGSNVVLTWEKQNGQPVLVRQAGLVEPFNDGPGKPINIQLHVGRPPILTGGNSNGDLEMMEFAEANGRSYLNLLLRHDDPDREYAYDHSAERIQQVAQDRDWTTISMKGDFKRAFADTVEKRELENG